MLGIKIANPPQEAASPLAQTWSPVPPPGPDPRNPRAVQVGLKKWGQLPTNRVLSLKTRVP